MLPALIHRFPTEPLKVMGRGGALTTHLLYHCRLYFIACSHLLIQHFYNT